MNSSKKKPVHYGGFAGPLPCNGSEGGITAKQKKDVTCTRCKRIIRNKERQGYVAVSGMFKKPEVKARAA